MLPSAICFARYLAFTLSPYLVIALSHRYRFMLASSLQEVQRLKARVIEVEANPAAAVKAQSSIMDMVEAATGQSKNRSTAGADNRQLEARYDDASCRVVHRVSTGLFCFLPGIMSWWGTSSNSRPHLPMSLSPYLLMSPSLHVLLSVSPYLLILTSP